MSRSQLEYLRHMLDEVNYLVTAKEGLSKEEFILDSTLKRAFVRSIEVIGEASKNISLELKNRYTQVNWRSISCMRDQLIHHYFGVDYDIVWDVLENKIPELREQLLEMLSKETTE